MHTKTVKPGSHTGISKYFGLVFLYQAFVAVCTALSEQLHDSAFSFYFAILSVAFTFLAVAVSIPATVAVAVPENHLKLPQEIVFIISLIVIMSSAFFLGPNLRAVIELPFVETSVNAKALGAMAGVFLMMNIAAAIRLFRARQGKLGAAMLLVGMLLASSSGVFWVYMEPLCRRVDIGDVWPESCPMPDRFSHNAIMALVMLVANFLAAEGAIRLMAAGSGLEFYSEITHYIDTTDPVIPSVRRTYRTYSVPYDCEDPYRSPPYPPQSILSGEAPDGLQLIS